MAINCQIEIEAFEAGMAGGVPEVGMAVRDQLKDRRGHSVVGKLREALFGSEQVGVDREL